MNQMCVSINDAVRRIFSYNRWESPRELISLFGYKNISVIFKERSDRFFKNFVYLNNPVLSTGLVLFPSTVF